MFFDKEYLFGKKSEVTVSKKQIENNFGTTKAIFIEGEPYNGNKTTFFAYVGVPNSEKPKNGYPAIVLVHGGGGCAFFEWVEFWNSKGYVAIAPDFSARQFGTVKLDGKAGYGIIEDNKNACPQNYGSFLSSSKEYKNSWSYHSVCNIIFAHNYLLGLDVVDKCKTAITGISWGAVLTCITAGVDDRFNAFAPVYGAGYYFSSPFVDNDMKNVSNDDLISWINCYDPSKFLDKCYKPVLFTLGMDDIAFMCNNNENSSRLCKGKVYYSFRGKLEHGHFWKDENGMFAVYHFIDKTLNGKNTKYSVSSKCCPDKTVKVYVNGSKNVKKATLWYTQSQEDIAINWKWECKNVKVGKKIVIKPEKDTTAFFVEFTDGNSSGLIFSSELFRF